MIRKETALPVCPPPHPECFMHFASWVFSSCLTELHSEAREPWVSCVSCCLTGQASREPWVSCVSCRLTGQASRGKKALPPALSLSRGRKVQTATTPVGGLATFILLLLSTSWPTGSSQRAAGALRWGGVFSVKRPRKRASEQLHESTPECNSLTCSSV